MPLLGLFVWVLIFLPIIFHTIYGLWLTKQGRSNVKQYPFGKNVFYLFQRISGLVLIAFLIFHITAMKGWWSPNLKFDPWRATETTVAHINASWIIAFFVYPLGILAASFHLAYGFWTAAITWGLAITSAAQRRWRWVCGVLFLFSFICGMTALLATLTPAAVARHG
jgi:succinate dehydrogenase / fumarate reductase cytochrome b subunit